MPLPMYTFNDTIPAGPNNPSNDQTPMLQNNISDQSIWTADHFGYNVNSSGYHQQVRMPNYTTYSPPIGSAIPSVIAGFGGVYCNNTTSTGASTETGLWYTSDNSTNVYQLTRTVTGNYALFGLNTNNYNGVGIKYTGGWTFLPGGILYQYGFYVPSDGFASAATAINFPVQFTNPPFNIQLTLVCKVGGTTNTQTPSVLSGSVTNSGFKWNMTSVPTAAYIQLNWVAIGV